MLLKVELYISRVEGISYHFIYGCKGQNRVTVELTDESGNQRSDNVREFQDVQFVSDLESLRCFICFTS